MSEERKLILQMVADGKLSPEEAEKLLQALDETERSAESAAAESVHSEHRHGLSDTIERVVGDSLRGLDESLREMEIQLERKLNDPARDQFFSKVEERMRLATERAMERARQAEERTVRATERAAARAAEKAQRMAEKIAARAAEVPETFIKMGVSIDKVTVERTEQLTLPAEPGDRLVLEGRVGDIAVAFTDAGQVEVDVRKTVWGTDEADANARADATPVRLVRKGQDVVAEVTRPRFTAFGLTEIRDTRIDYTVRVPHGTRLQIDTRVGDIKVAAGDAVSHWDLSTKVGDVELQVGPGAGFRFEVATTLGDVHVDLPGAAMEGPGRGRCGDGSGMILADVKTGDIRIRQ